MNRPLAYYADAPARLAARVAARESLDGEIARARGDEALAHAEYVAAFERHVASVEALDSNDEHSRVLVRDTAGATYSAQVRLDEARRELDRVLTDRRAALLAISRVAAEVIDPALLEAVTADAAIAVLPTDVAERFAAGDVELVDVRALLDAIAAFRAAEGTLTAHGAQVAPIDEAVFWLPWIEARAARGVPTTFAPLEDWRRAETMPPTKPNQLVDWLRAKSDDAPGVVDRGQLEQVRSWLAAGFRRFDDLPRDGRVEVDRVRYVPPRAVEGYERGPTAMIAPPMRLDAPALDHGPEPEPQRETTSTRIAATIGRALGLRR